MQQHTKVSLDGPWLLKADSLDRGMEEGWFRPGHDRSDWKPVQVAEYWDRYDLTAFDGIAWYATSFELHDTTDDLAVFFGGVDDDADVWINGIKVGSHVGYSEPFFFKVHAAVRRGHNELVVRVNDYGGPGGIYGPVHLVPAGRVHELLRTKYADLPARPSPDWVRDAVVYEVYLRSFSREGTLRALERRIPELKDLGVTVIWLMPIHPIGDLNRKGRLGSPYAVQDYYGVNPEFGTLDDFRSLVRTVHAHGMKIILDLVANHTAWDSKLMMEHPDWFTTNEEGAIVAPNADWYDVADLNYRHHELRKYMIEMMKYWIREIGIDGFRCDVSELVPTDFWNRARKELEKIKPVMMISEGTIPEHHVEAFDLTYSWNVYDVLQKVIRSSTPAGIFDDLLRMESLRFPRGALRLRFNTNHDKNAWDAPAVVKFTPGGAKATAVLIFTLPGIPLVYNGEEVGNDRSLDLFDKVEIDWQKNPDFRILYQKLGSLRAQSFAVRRGGYEKLENSDDVKVFSFLREAGGDHAVVIINFSNAPAEVRVKLPDRIAGGLRDYFTGVTNLPARGMLDVRLESFGYFVFVPAAEKGAP